MTEILIISRFLSVYFESIFTQIGIDCAKKPARAEPTALYWAWGRLSLIGNEANCESTGEKIPCMLQQASGPCRFS